MVQSGIGTLGIPSQDLLAVKYVNTAHPDTALPALR